MEILATKIHLPPAGRTLARPRLFAAIDAGIARGCRLTLVAAPAGCGKTSLLAGWLAHSRRPAAWLSLDPEDNDLTRFLSYLLESLHHARPDLATGLREALPGSTPPPIEALLTSLLNQLAERAEPLVLVLEDDHVIERPKIDAALLFLVEHAPAQLHIIVTSRHDPLLPLARLRANGLLSEIRADELRFTPGESAEFLAAANPPPRCPLAGRPGRSRCSRAARPGRQ
jgi:LuxR family transcriptional regulator, maltose regulon positive regulatory protein